MDKERFEKLYLEHFAELVAYGRNMGAGRKIIEDVIQDLFLDLWQRRTSLHLPWATI